MSEDSRAAFEEWWLRRYIGYQSKRDKSFADDAWAAAIAWASARQAEVPSYDEWARRHGIYDLPHFRNLHGDFRECWYQARKDLRAELQKTQEDLRSITTQRDLLSANAVSAENKLDELAGTYRQQFIEEVVQWLAQQTSPFTHNDFREEMISRKHVAAFNDAEQERKG